MRMTYRKVRSTAAALAVSAMLSTPLSAHQETAQRLLERVADASGDDLARVRSGGAFVRTVEDGDESGVTTVSAVRIRAPLAFVLDRTRTEHLLLDDAPDGGSRGRFGSPPAIDDIRRLELDRREIRDLERCRPGECDLKLTAGAIERLHRQIDWSARDSRERANEFFRRELVASVVEYAGRGDAGAPVYADKAGPLSVADGFDVLLGDARFLMDFDADFHRHLTLFPAVGSTDVEDGFTWAVEDLGSKSVVSLNHIATKARGPEGSAVIGVKRIYANHYLQAGLRLLVLAPGGADRDDGDTYVTVITRYRFDGEVSGLRRTAMERRLESNAEAVLIATRDRLEASFAEQDQANP